jgi:hypothetical protein
MKNKLRLIDVSLLSSYMGKALTGIVTLFVIGIAVSALIDRGGFERSVIRVCVPSSFHPGESVEAYEPFKVLLSRETRRPVVLTESNGQWPRGYDLFVMSSDAYFDEEKSLGIVAIFEVSANPGRRDKALIISRNSSEEPDLSRAGPGDVAFSHPLSVNGFWVQAEAIARSGSNLVDHTDELKFEGARWDASRVIHGVLFGVFAFGACKSSEIERLSDTGEIDSHVVRKVYSTDAMPEIVVAVDRADADYFRAKIGSLARLLEQPAPPSPQGDTVRLLERAGVAGFEPLEGARLERLRSLYERFGRGARPHTAVSP